MNQSAQNVVADSPREPRSRRPGGWAGWAALLVVWVVWGSTYLAIRVADRTIPPFPMAATRYLIAGLLLYPVARLGGRRRSAATAQGPPAHGPLAQWAGMAVVGTMLLAFGNGAASYAERTLPSGLVALLIASVPLWMALADRVINGRRLRPVAWAALLIGLTGIAILARPHGNGTVLPVIVVLAGAMSWGIGSVLAGSAINPFVMDAWQAPIAYGRLCALMNIGGPRRAARRPARVTARVRRKTRLMTIIMVMTMTIPLADAKARLSAVLDEVRDTHERVVITRNGRPEAVLISVSDLEALEDTLDLLSTPGALDEIQAAEAEIARGEAVGADELRRLMAERTRAEQGGE